MRVDLQRCYITASLPFYEKFLFIKMNGLVYLIIYNEVDLDG